MGRTIPIPKINDGEKEIKIKNNKCPNCGANITIMMHGRTLNAVKCEYCGSIVGTI